MKTIFTLFLIVVTAHVISAQSWGWAHSSFAFSCDNYGKGIVSDKNGNTYITGRFSSPSMDFLGLPNLLNANSTGCYEDYFIAKFDSLGNTVWAQRAGGSGDDGGNSIAMDTSGNIYVTGYFAGGSVTFDTVTVSTVSPGANFFIVKYTPSGNALWGRVATGAGDQIGNSIATDRKNNVYVTGAFQNKIIFGTDTVTTNTGESAFIVKYDATGNKLWAQAANVSGFGSGTDHIRGEGICTDVSGHTYISGMFSSATMIMNSDTLMKISAGPTSDIFLLKLDSLGNALWAKNYGANNDLYTNSSVTTDKFGNVFLTGGYGNAMAMGSTMLPMRSPGNKIFTAKLNSSGAVLWAQSAGLGLNPSYGTDVAPNQGRSIVSDSSGNVWITGNLTDSATFGAISLYGFTGVFLVKYDPLGNAVFGTSVNGTDYNAGNGVSLDKNQTPYITGFFQSLNLTFVPYTISNYGFRNVFIAKLGPGLTTDMVVLSKESSFIIYPNPNNGAMSFEYELKNNDKGEVEIYDITGRKIVSYELETGSKIITISETTLNSGMYFYIYKINGSVEKSEKIIIAK